MAAEAGKAAGPAAARIPLLGGLVAAGVLLVDQLSKAWVLHVFDLPARRHVDLSPIMDLSMVWNRGVSFGLLQADTHLMRWFWVVFAITMSGVLAWWLSRAPRPLLGISLGMMIGGALGNAIDRVVYGAVVDFLDFSDIWFHFVFNIADASISVGVAVLLLDSLLAERREKE